MPFIPNYSASPDTSRGPAPNLWRYDWLAYKADPSRGFGYEDEFMDLPTGKYVLIAENGGSGGAFSLSGNVNGGAALLDTNETAGDDGYSVQVSNGAGSPSGHSPFTLSAGRELVFEAGIIPQVASGTDPNRIFIGMTTAGAIWNSTPILAATDYIGILADASLTPGFVSKNASTATLSSQTLGTSGVMVHGTKIKLGFRARLGSDGYGIVNVYANGQRIIEEYRTNAVPVGAIGVCLSAITHNTTEPNPSIDWWRALLVY